MKRKSSTQKNTPAASLRVVAENLRRIKGFQRDADIASALGLSPTAFSTRKGLDSVPYEAVCEYCLREGISLDLVFGVPVEEWLAGKPEEREVLASFRKLGGEVRRAAQVIADCLGREFGSEEPQP